jgi:hypothetical protein
LQTTFDRNDPEDLREIPDTLTVTLSDNDSSENHEFGIRLYAYIFGYQTQDDTQALTAGLTASIRGNTCTGNGAYGVAMEPGFPNRIDPRRWVVTFAGSFEGNSFGGNGRAPALFDFTRWKVSLGTESPLTYKFVEGSMYQVTDIDGELAGFDYDHPVTDPISGRVLDSTFTVNGVEVPHGTRITPP